MMKHLRYMLCAAALCAAIASPAAAAEHMISLPPSRRRLASFIGGRRKRHLCQERLESTPIRSSAPPISDCRGLARAPMTPPHERGADRQLYR